MGEVQCATITVHSTTAEKLINGNVSHHCLSTGVHTGRAYSRNSKLRIRGESELIKTSGVYRNDVNIHKQNFTNFFHYL